MSAHTHDGIDWVARLADLRLADEANAPAYRSVADRLIEPLPAPHPTVLDVGCGAGGMSAALAAALAARSGGTLVLIDAVPELLAAAAHAATTAVPGDTVEVRTIRADLAALGEPDAIAPPASGTARQTGELTPSAGGAEPSAGGIGSSPADGSALSAGGDEPRARGAAPSVGRTGSAAGGSALSAGGSAPPAGGAASSVGGIGSGAGGSALPADGGAPSAGGIAPSGGPALSADRVAPTAGGVVASVAGIASPAGESGLSVDGVAPSASATRSWAGEAGPPAADLVWASNVAHHVPDQRRVVRGLVGWLGPGGCLALAEGGLSMRCLPWDLGVGEPGLQDRLIAAHGTWFHGMRTGMPGSVRLPVGWNRVLADVGLSGVTAFSYLVDVPAPLGDTGRAAVVSWLAWMTRATGDLLDADDLATLNRLLDPDDIAYVGRRDDIFLLKASTVYLGWRR